MEGRHVRLPEAALKYVGVESEIEIAIDPVERGQVRRHAQAIGDEDPIYWETCDANKRYGGPVAQPFFPIHMFRRAYGTEDPVEANAADPDYDGALKVRGGLPEIEPLTHMPVMNGPDAMREIRRTDGAAARTPIIALTADLVPDHVREFLNAGADVVVGKPVDWGILEGWLRQLTRERVPAARAS